MPEQVSSYQAIPRKAYRMGVGVVEGVGPADTWDIEAHVTSPPFLSSGLTDVSCPIIPFPAEQWPHGLYRVTSSPPQPSSGLAH
jgi:hypothetical protein